MWEVVTRDLFEHWLAIQNGNVQEEILAILTVLELEGPMLGRPYVDHIKDSSYPNMKELRVQVDGHPFRVFFVFDPVRRAIILCAGNKKSEKEKLFYKRMIKLADAEYKSHLLLLEVKENGDA